MVIMRQEELDSLEKTIKRLHPETRQGYHGRVTIEVDFKDSVIGRHPHIEFRCVHLVRIEAKK